MPRKYTQPLALTVGEVKVVAFPGLDNSLPSVFMRYRRVVGALEPDPAVGGDEGRAQCGGVSRPGLLAAVRLHARTRSSVPRNQTQPSAVTKGEALVSLAPGLESWLPSVLHPVDSVVLPWNQTQPSAVTTGDALVV